MNNILTRILIVITGYLFGLFQTGWILGRIKHVNLKQLGSGNTGATNAFRVMGIKSGLIVLLGDAVKGFIPCMLVRMLFRDYPSDVLNSYLLYAGLGCVLGNNYPFFLGFNGGKGVAVSLGWILAWYPWTAVICLFVFLILSFSTRYVSVASIACCVTVIAATHYFAYQNFGWMQSLSVSGAEFLVLGLIIPLLVIIRHHDNIRRLINGTENRFGKK